jgi:ribA/ribD-fused uncharacterized protein
MTPEERLAELQAADAAGEAIDVLPFWGHQPEADGSAGVGCLSQWWPSEFTVDGVTYPTAEHWMMASKARVFGDAEGLAAVMTTITPYAAKKAGRAVRGFEEKAWHRVRYQIVVDGNRAKFGQHPELAAYLRSTGRRVIVEASPYDRIWGVGMATADPDVAHPLRWKGINLLGFALMDVRDQL